MKTDYKKQIKEYIWVILIAVVISTFVRENVFSMAHVVGHSMNPTLEDSDIIVVNKMHSTLHHGDVVNVAGVDETKVFVKRVIGVAGDAVQILDGLVYINNEPETGGYLTENTYTQALGETFWIIPDGHVFVLGDNRGNSLDSRDFGPVNLDNIVGEGAFIAFPFTRLGGI